MDPATGKMYLFLPTVRDVWEAVQEIYSDVENSTQNFELKRKSWKSKQSKQEQTKYYNTMKGSGKNWIYVMKKEWGCTTDGVRHMKRVENDRVFVFLAGLNKILDEIRHRIWVEDPYHLFVKYFLKLEGNKVEER